MSSNRNIFTARPGAGTSAVIESQIGPRPRTNSDWLKANGYDFTPEQYARNKAQLTWCSFGLDGKGPLQNIPLQELSTEHILNILINMHRLDDLLRVTMLLILKERFNRKHLRDKFITKASKG
jgi:hypothetical protein